jgi:hypothetical protein
MSQDAQAPVGQDASTVETQPDPFELLELDASQDALLRELSTVIGEAVGLDPIPCHGLWLRAVRTWQTTHGRPASSITATGPRERERAAREIRDAFVELAHEVLRTPDQRGALARAIQEAFALYMHKYNKRDA